MASKSCKEFLTVKSRTVFKLFWHRVNASSNLATVTFFTVFKMCRHRVNAVLMRKSRIIDTNDLTNLKHILFCQRSKKFFLSAHANSLNNTMGDSDT